jgi:asparagine synthase (glutamine-hydrolysing)
LVAKHFGTEHIETVAEPQTVELLPELARQYDEPIGDSSIVPTYLVSRVIRQHAKVALGGDGGDELFGGYLHHSWIQRQDRIRRWIPQSMRSGLYEIAANVLPVGLRGRNYFMGVTADSAYSIAHVNLYFDSWMRRRLLASGLNRRPGHDGTPEQYRVGLCNSEYSMVRRVTETDFRTTLVDAYLVKVDRASMLASLEVRCPWLDHRLVEFAFARVPDALRVTETERKVLPRRLAKGLLPSKLDLDRKQGFAIPLSSWFKGRWGQFVETVLTDCDSDLFNRGAIQRLITGQRLSYVDNTGRLFALMMFELWRREYKVAVSV